MNKKANSEMKLVKNFANKKAMILIGILAFSIITMACNCITNLILDIPLLIKGEFKFKIFNFILKPNFDFFIIYIISYVIFGLSYIKFIFNIRASYGNMIEGQKGTSRFATQLEISEQYKSINSIETEKERETLGYSGKGGAVISRYKEKVYIDDGAVNNLIIGMTRSGKGETYIFPTIDAYSRAKEKASLIFNDPKGELFLNSKRILEERGYEIYAFNLINQMNSMSYNILELVTEAYIKGNYSEAQLLCKTITNMMYYNPQEKNPFWSNCAMSLVNALILAITEEAFKDIVGMQEELSENYSIDLENEINERIKEAKNKVNMFAVANMLLDLGADTNPITKENSLDKYFTNLPMGSIAKLQYATSKFAEGECRAGIFTVAMDKLQTFTLDETAKLTSKNSVRLEDIGFYLSARIKSKIRVVKNLDNTENNFKLINSLTGKVKLKNIKSVYTTKIGNKISREELLKGVIAEGVKGNELRDKIEIKLDLVNWNKEGEYTIYFLVKDKENSKPKAIFLITPDYDTSNHVLPSLYIKQLYYVLSKKSSNLATGKCDREVVFLLDEAGNMTAIEGLDTMTTVCLGRGMRFHFIVQSYEQLKKLYGESYKTIISNCGNKIYIKTDDTMTNEDFSKTLGDETIVVNGRSGEILDTTKHQTETLDSRRLLRADELSRLNAGDSVIIRTMKTRDLKGNKIIPYPIFNTGETSMKFRFEYLGDFFSTNEGLEDVEIPTIHKNVDLKEIQKFIRSIKNKQLQNEEIKDKKLVEKDIEKQFEKTTENLNKKIIEKLNNEDFETLKKRLYLLKEIDMKEDINLKELLEIRENEKIDDEVIDELIEKINS